MDNSVKYYMQRVDKTGYNVIDIEKEFMGLKVISCENINKIGKAKNIYIEQYPESDKLRVSLPTDDNYTNEATIINLKVAICGDSKTRQVILEDFSNYIRIGKHHYKDTFRFREFDFIVKDEIKISDEMYEGDNPYIILNVPLQNINGKTELSL